MKTQKLSIIRQGDVLLIPVAALPAGCVEIKPEGGRIVLMHGEVTGHAHAIYDHEAPVAKKISMKRAGQLAAQAIDLAQSRAKARLMQAPNGIRYLDVSASVNLRHEEHTAHEIQPGIYEVPVQMEHSIERVLRQVAD